MKIIEKLKNKNYSLDTIGESGANVLVFDDFVLKIQKNNEEAQNELKTLLWLEKQEEIVSPRIFEAEIRDENLFILMEKMDEKFSMACDKSFLSDEDVLSENLAAGLNLFWKLDISNCPSKFNLEEKLRQAEENVKNNLVDVECFQSFNAENTKNFKNPFELLQWLKSNKPKIKEEEKCFSHGDFCLPNIFFNKDLKNTKKLKFFQKSTFGIIDVGRSGILDRWNDIAICYRSLKDNTSGIYGKPEYRNFKTEKFFEKLNIEPDWRKIEYYLLLDELF